MNQSQPSRPDDCESNPGLTAPPMGRRERRAAETRVKLFRSALQLFSERGFANVTVEEITEAADVGKGTFFNYFETKDHVLGVLAEIQVSKLHEAIEATGKGKKPLRTVLYELVQRLAEEPGRSPGLARTFISSFLASAAVRTTVQGNMRMGRGILAELVASGQERGEIDPRLNKDKVATQFLQMLMGTFLLWSLHEEPPLTEWIENSFQHFWRAVAAPGKKQAL